MGLEDLHIHGTRGFLALRALELGESLSTIGRLPSHSQVETTACYAPIRREMVRGMTIWISSSH